MSHRSAAQRMVLCATVILIGVTCTGAPTPNPSPTRTAIRPVHYGMGTPTFGIERWPACVNPITSCSMSGSLFRIAVAQVLPRAMEEDLRGNFVASPLLTQTPTTANGGVRLHPFTITFHIDPRAAWTDRTPITAVDFAFTWRAILHTKGARSTAGYDQIRSIDASDPAIVVIHFKAPYGDWPELFGGSRGFVLKRTAFRPAQRRSGDLSNAMHDLIGFSGGPWKMTQWTQRQEILVRNDRYWSNQSLLDQVTLIPIATQSLGVESLLRGQLDVIALTRPSQGLVDRMRSDPNVRLAIGRRTVTAWRADKVAGPIGKDSSSVYGPFFNMDLWHERSS